MKSKRGAYFFLIDVILVIFILFVTVVTILSFRSQSPSLLGIDQQLETYSFELYRIEVRDYTSQTINTLRQPGGAIYDEGWAVSMPLDELIALLVANGYTQDATSLVREVVQDLPRKYGFNYTLNGTGTMVTVYNRTALVDKQNSVVKLSKKKISWPRSSLNQTYEPYLSEVSIWQ